MVLPCYFQAQGRIIVSRIWGGEQRLPAKYRKSCQVYRCIKESLCNKSTLEIRQKITGVVLQARQLVSVKLFGAKHWRLRLQAPEQQLSAVSECNFECLMQECCWEKK